MSFFDSMCIHPVLPLCSWVEMGQKEEAGNEAGMELQGVIELMKLGNAGWRLGCVLWSMKQQSWVASAELLSDANRSFWKVLSESISVPWLKQNSYTQKCHRKRKENDDLVWLADISSHIQWGFRVSEMLQILSWGIKLALETQHVVKAAVVCLSKAQPQCPMMLCTANVPVWSQMCWEFQLWNFVHMVFFVTVSILNVLKSWMYKGSLAMHTLPKSALVIQTLLFEMCYLCFIQWMLSDEYPVRSLKNRLAVE